MKTARQEQKRLREAIRLIYLLRPDILREAASDLEAQSRRGGESYRERRSLYGG